MGACVTVLVTLLIPALPLPTKHSITTRESLDYLGVVGKSRPDFAYSVAARSARGVALVMSESSKSLSLEELPYSGQHM